MEENQKIPMRSQVKKEDTWAIEDMYATVEDWEKDFAAAKKVAEEAAEYAGRLGESAQALYDWSALTEKLDCMLSEIYGYASRVKDQDTADAAGQTLSARAMGLYVECSGLISFADPEILSIPEEKLEAFYAEKCSLPLRETEGKVCSEFVMCYPPGIPILAPGERITPEILDYIEYAKAKGCNMTGPEDPDILRLNVLEHV